MVNVSGFLAKVQFYFCGTKRAIKMHKGWAVVSLIIIYKTSNKQHSASTLFSQAVF
jgi:hypothetical protein